MPTCRKSELIHKMEIACDLFESFSADAAGNGGIVEHLVRGPVISDLWFTNKSHQDIKSEVCPELLLVG